ncbi:MAG: flagellar assembly protein FliW, partial [Dethiobacteria bacterium]
FPCFPSYNLELPKSEQEELELEQKEDVLIFTTVTVLGEDEMTTNLAAPIVINAARRIAKQIIIPDKIEQMRTPLPLS